MFEFAQARPVLSCNKCEEGILSADCMQAGVLVGVQGGTQSGMVQVFQEDIVGHAAGASHGCSVA